MDAIKGLVEIMEIKDYLKAFEFVTNSINTVANSSSSSIAVSLKIFDLYVGINIKGKFYNVIKNTIDL